MAAGCDEFAEARVIGGRSGQHSPYGRGNKAAFVARLKWTGGKPRYKTGL
ncbi:MAG TPA: hypothetical protein VHX43_04865 [Xanthobacteraceae bacterium]|jgi:hypothetical protein|nr:hypothetical protein [Xanthobacteraceae bacterium]